MTKPALIAFTMVVVGVLRSQAHASTVPSAPTSPLATPGISGASVSFTPSASDGGSPIFRYTVTSNPGGITAIGGAPPIAVSGLTNGISYTFTATATNNNGTSAASAASNTVVPSAALAPWYNTLWTERQTITVAGSAAGAQTNYPVKITLAYAAGMKPDFSDLRFTDSSGTLLLSYWVETEADGFTAVVWVKVPSVPIAPDTATIYAYYGNPAAVSLSNGDTTFTFFDTFGSGGTPGDWNYTNNMIGEHAIIHNGQLYAPLYDSDHGVNGGLVVLNPVTGSVIKHFTIPGYCTAAAPAFDKNGYLHVYDCGGFLAKLDENSGTILRTLNIGSAVDWEAVAYDPVNDVILIASKDDHSLSAVRSSDYSLAWRNTDVNLTYGSSEIDPPLIVGAYVYWQDYSGALFKISLSTGITAASTNATSAGLPATPYAFSSYSQIIYDSVNNRLYLTNSTGHTAFAVNPTDLSVTWSRVVESAGWNFNRGGAWHNNVWYVTARETAYPYRSRIYALDTQNSGNILWTNTTAYDNGAEVSSILADYNYVYAGTYDYSDQDYNKLLMLNVLDGSVAATIPLLNGVASSIPTFYGGKIIMGLWYDVSGQQVGGYQALQVRDGGGTGDFYYKADLYQTGYVGAFASGPLSARTACGYPSLDPTKWIANGLSSITDCMAASTVNVSGWADYFKSTLTFSRSNTAIRVRAKNSEPSSNSWDTWLGFTNNIGVCDPVCSGRNNGQMLFTYDQNGAPQTTFGPAYDFDRYNTSEIKMAYPSIRFDVDDSNVGGSANWSTSYDQAPIQLGNFKGIATVDWVLVRNYANPEPAPSIGEGIGVTVPSAPLSPVATPGNGQAAISFIPPVSNGGSLITGYTVTSHPGNSHAGGGASPIVVPGLTNGTSYTFTVTASNATGDSSPSAASNSVTPGAPPTLTVAKTHSGYFTQGQNGAMYSVTVSNATGAGPTSGTVKVTETAPPGLTLVSMAGTNWTCASGGNTCTRGDPLPGGSSYEPIAVTVNVASNAGTPLSNSVSVSGGGSPNNSYSDSTNITAVAASITATQGSGQSAQINAAFVAALQAKVTDAGGNPVSGVTVTFTAPSSGASGTFGGLGTTATAASNASGLAGAPTFTANSLAGGYNVTASVAGVSPSAIFTLTNAAACTYFAGAPSVLLTAAGGSGAILVTATTGCAWTAISNASWLTVTSGAAGSGSGTVNYSAAPNNTGQSRAATITIATAIFYVTQTGTGPNQPPSIVSLSPFSGSGNQIFTLGFSDPNGWADIAHAYLIINLQTWVANSCYVDFNVAANTVALMNDAGTSWLGPVVAGSAVFLSNSQCKVSAAGSSASGSGNNLTVTLALAFQPSYTGPKRTFLMATDSGGLTADWLAYGVWYPNPLTASLVKRYRLYFPVTLEHLYTTDLNEYNVLGAEGWNQEGADAAVYSGPAALSGVNTVPMWRLYYTTNMTHMWTTDRNEYLTLMNYQGMFIGEGADEFLFPSQVANSIPLYRLLFNGGGPPIHHWTTDAYEFSVLTAPGGGWTSEGIPGYLFPPSMAVAQGEAPVVAVAQAGIHVEEAGQRRVNGSGAPEIGAIVHGASYEVGPEALGQVIRLYGSFPEEGELGVVMGGVEAEVITRTEREIQAVIPETAAGARVSVTVMAGGRRSNAMEVELVDAAPGLFASDPYGRGQAQAANEDGSANSAASPAAAGSMVTLRLTGHRGRKISVQMGGRPAEVVSQRELGSGKGEVRVRIPEGLAAGAAVPVRVKAGEFFGQAGVTLAVR